MCIYASFNCVCHFSTAFTATKLVVKAPRKKRHRRLPGRAPASASMRSTSRQAVGISALKSRGTTQATPCARRPRVVRI